jgi:hypothetical protein
MEFFQRKDAKTGREKPGKTELALNTFPTKLFTIQSKKRPSFPEAALHLIYVFASAGVGAGSAGAT